MHRSAITPGGPSNVFGTMLREDDLLADQFALNGSGGLPTIRSLCRRNEQRQQRDPLTAVGGICSNQFKAIGVRAWGRP